MTIRFVAILCGTAALGLASMPAFAQGRLQERVQQGVEKVRAACGEDVAKFCGQVTPGGGNLILCMQAHEDKLSPKCDYALFEASRNLHRALDRLGQAADACAADAEKHCSSVEPGGGGILKCLAANKADLGKGCKRVIEKVEAAAK
jgi:hypothetical protein